MEKQGHTRARTTGFLRRSSRCAFALPALLALVVPLSAAVDDGRLAPEPGMYDGIEVDEPYIWPPPRQVEFSDCTVPLVADSRRQALILLGDDASPQAQIGAEEISRRVADLNLLAVNLPMRRYGAMTWDDLKGQSVVIIGTRQDNAMVDRLCRKHNLLSGEETTGRDENYIIRFLPWADGHTAILVAGRGDVGALYGCYSLAQLLRGEGRSVVGLSATVTDWPGFKYRVTGWGSAAYNEKNKDDVREYVDFLAHLKLNLGVGGGCAVPQITRFGEKRGFRQVDGYYSMSKFSRYAAENIDRDCIPKGNSGNCWSDPGLKDLYRENWAHVARSASGIAYHDNTDAGWWTPYMRMWRNRCELCRSTYPQSDPRVADAERFNIIYDAAKSQDPDRLVVITLPCYYDVPDRFPQMVEYLKYIGEHTPPDMIFMLEDRGPAECAAYERYLGRECCNFLYPDTGFRGKTWAEDFTSAIALEGHVAGYWYSVGHRYHELLTALAAAYAWNPDLSDDLHYLYRVLVPRAAHHLYGDAWREMAELFILNLDPRSAGTSTNPDELADILDRARRSVELASEACPQLSGRALVTCRYMVSRSQGLVHTAAWRLAYTRGLKALADGLRLVQEDKLADAESVLQAALGRLDSLPSELRGDAARQRIFKYLALDLRKLSDRISRHDLTLLAREPLWQIGEFDNRTAEFVGDSDGPPGEFTIGDALSAFPASGGYTIRFSGALPDGGRLLVRAQGKPFSVSVDGTELYYAYGMVSGYNDITVAVPALELGDHKIVVKPDARLNTDAVALYPGTALVPTSAANEWLLDTAGTWDFRLDPGDVGEAEAWYKQPIDPDAWTTISVPGFWESDARYPTYDGIAWYHTSIKLPWQHHTRPVYVRFGGVDDYTKLYVAGEYIGKHDKEDSEFNWFDEPFEFNVSGKMPFADGADIYVRVEDDHGLGGIHGPVTIAIILGGREEAPVVGPGALGF